MFRGLFVYARGTSDFPSGVIGVEGSGDGVAHGRWLDWTVESVEIPLLRFAAIGKSDYRLVLWILSVGRFSLTPALSRWEREEIQPPLSYLISRGRRGIWGGVAPSPKTRRADCWVACGTPCSKVLQPDSGVASPVHVSSFRY